MSCSLTDLVVRYCTHKDSPSIINVLVKVGVIPISKLSPKTHHIPPLQQRASWIEYLSIQQGVHAVAQTSCEALLCAAGGPGWG
eukprot:1227442-Amphidinium_carterae.2